MEKLVYRKIADSEKALQCFSILKIPKVVVVFCATEMQMCFLVIVLDIRSLDYFSETKKSLGLESTAAKAQTQVCFTVRTN